MNAKNRFTVAVAMVMFLACGPSVSRRDEARKELVSRKGTIVYLSLEGGFYGIVDDKGGHWDPTNLWKEYQVDGLRVWFEGVATYEPTTHMWGTPIELTKIKPLDS